ncbi:hypothetical protein AB0H86_36305 [Streptomyces sp. NPDC050997]
MQAAEVAVRHRGDRPRRQRQPATGNPHPPSRRGKQLDYSKDLDR